MKRVSILNTMSQLKKMPVVLPETGGTVGQISDVVIHPIEGTVLGLIVKSTEGATCAVAANDFFIFNRNNVVVVLESALSGNTVAREKIADGISACREAIGARIVTEKGKYLGYVSDVLITEEQLLAVYQILESHWQKYLGRGFYISADLPYAWSHDGTRFIVREDEVTRHRSSQPDEAIRQDSHETATEEKSQSAGR
jgi:sporulation protein YlmC with PRC-barrel domain